MKRYQIFTCLYIACISTCLTMASTNVVGKPDSKPQSSLESNYLLTLGEETFDPKLQVITNPSEWEVASQLGKDLRLIQFDGPIQESWIESMRESGVEPIQYIHPYTYITWASAEERNDASTMRPVRWAGDFVNGYRVLPRWRSLSAASIQTQALIYRGVELKNVLDQFTDAGATRIEHSALDNRFTAINFITPGNSLLELSQIVGVFTIQPTPTDGGLRSEMSNQINAGNYDSGNNAYPGYEDWLNDVGLSGSGAIIAIVDGGSDNSHVDLSGQFVDCQGQSCGGSASSSHGTHTAGIVGATGASGTTDSFGFLRGQGVAPGVSLVEQTYSPTYQQPGGMTLLMTESHRNGASASSNSWGPSGSPQGYDIDTLETDIGIRDADPDIPGNQQFSYVLAIMNGNGGTSSQGSPDEAKNIFTIGSTKMQTSGGTQYTAINDISSNSAHGPCLDGRIIPHMVAPGCSVDSTTPGSYGLMCGTSMACPQVAGGVALFIEQYREEYDIDPSPALIKASFTAAALDLAGNDDADGNTLGHPFDSKQGWGRMYLPSVLGNESESVRYFDAPVVLEQTGDDWTTVVSPIDPSKPMKIMLVWTDAVGHGLGGSTPAWNNDLDLTVNAGISTYRGNNIGSSGWSTTGGSYDGKNNTEGVFLGPTSPSQATIVVNAANLNSDGIPGEGDSIDQDFSLVCYNCAAEPSFSITPEPSIQSICAPGSVDYTIMIGQIMDYDEEVALSAVTPPGMAAVFSETEVVPPATVTLTIVSDESVEEITHTIPIFGVSADMSQESAVQIGVSRELPSSVMLSEPSDGETEVPVMPAFEWFEEQAAINWRFQLSTTKSTSGIIHDVLELDTSEYQLPMLLESNTPYFWRVQASNHCGDGFWSSWWTFRTTDAMVVMLVDDDDNSPDVRSTYTSLLDSLGILYEIYDTNNSNNEPSESELHGFPLVIWFTGDEFGGSAGPGSAGEAALATYIDAGGHLLMSSQDYLYDNGLTDFGGQYLGIGSFDSDVYQTSVTGAGELFGDLGTVPLSYPFSNWSDIVSPSSEAELAFSGNEGDAAVHLAGEDGGGAVFLGFPIESMPVDSQYQFMQDVVNWLGTAETVCPQDCNGDGYVDVADLLSIIDAWGTSSGCDINGDGQINVADLLEVVGNWGSCP
ncbi:MAG: S8 family serine peptidase [Planctomycetota bacterium]|nr:S8 family serine peptidase [Planctomycetota bacterium]